MKFSYTSLVASLTVGVALAAASVPAQAETYDGVQTTGAMVSRSSVAQQAAEMARAGNIYGEASLLSSTPARGAGLSRDVVRAEAVAVTRLGNVFGDAAFTTPRQNGALTRLASARAMNVELGLAQTDGATGKSVN